MVSPLRACRIIILLAGAGSKTNLYSTVEKGSFVDLHEDLLDDDGAVRVGPGWLIHSMGFVLATF
jgi:hypothetical protein